MGAQERGRWRNCLRRPRLTQGCKSEYDDDDDDRHSMCQNSFQYMKLVKELNGVDLMDGCGCETISVWTEKCAGVQMVR